MNNTALRIENGMSSFELLQAKVSSLEATEKRMSIEEDRRIGFFRQYGWFFQRWNKSGCSRANSRYMDHI